MHLYTAKLLMQENMTPWEQSGQFFTAKTGRHSYGLQISMIMVVVNFFYVLELICWVFFCEKKSSFELFTYIIIFVVVHNTFYFLLKSSFSEKATKIWGNHPQGFDITKYRQNFENDCAKFCGFLRKAVL